MELKDYLRILKRRWFVILPVAMLTFVIQYSFVLNKPIFYQTSSEVLFRQSPYELGYVLEEEYPSFIIPIESRIALLTGEDVVNNTAKKLAENKIVLTDDEVRGMVRTSKKSEQNKDIAIVTATGTNKETIIAVANYLIEAYLDFDIKTSLENVDAAIAAGTKKAQELSAEVEKIHSDITDSIINNVKQDKIWDADLQGTIKVNQLTSLESTRQQNIIEMMKLEKRIKGTPQTQKKAIEEGMVAKHLPPTEPSAASVAEPTEISKEIYALQSRLAKLRKRYTEENPQIQDIKEEMSSLQEALKQSLSRVATTKLEDLKLQKDLLADTSKFVDEVISGQWEQLIKLSQKKQEIEAKKAKLAETQARLNKIKDRLDSLELARKARSAERVRNVVTLKKADKATPLPSAEKASIPLMIIISVIVGAASGYVTEYLNDTLRTSADVTSYMNLPTIITIPQFKLEKISLLEVATKSPVYELYNKLATFIQQTAMEQRAKSILFTSAKAEEGKSTISSNLAIAIAQGGENVVLIDTDLRKPQFHQYFNLDNSKGLSTILSGEMEAEQKLAGITKTETIGANLDAYLQKTPIDTLKIITSGPLPPNPVSLLKSDRLINLLTQLKKRAGFTILDSPPILGVIDAAILATIVDVTIIVVAENSVRRPEAAQLKHALKTVDANVIGVVINKAGYTPETYYYYYYRYRGYGEGE